jgi:predicted AlkP superfamily pyrophosphatase or phosphodiesterase
MHNLSDKCLTMIKAHKHPGFELNSDFIFPYLNGYSVANLPASIFQSLGLAFKNSIPLDNGITGSFTGIFDDVILLVVDSLGMPLFNRLLDQIQQDPVHSNWNPLLERATLACITSTVPSTTTTVLTTLWTGMEASQHGLVGYEMWLKEFDVIANMISHAPVDQADDIGSLCKLGFDPLKFLPVECVGSRLKKAGIKTKAYLHASIAGSGLSQMLMTDAEMNAWRTYDELWQMLLAKQGPNNQRTYTNIYLGDIDTLSHRRGPGHELVWQAWLNFSNQLADFLKRLKKTSKRKILFLLTADHGQVDQEIKDDFELKRHPELLRMLKRMPSGESRLPYLYPLQGNEDKVISYIQQAWPGKFGVMRREDFIASGVLGFVIPSDVIKDRIGELVVIPAGRDYLRWAPKENHLLGRHGGFLPEEMLVPLLAIQL